MDCAGPVLAAPIPRILTAQSRNGCQVVTDDRPRLPPGFPQVLNHPLSWTGAHFTDESQYIYQLSSADLIEIGTALDIFKGTSPIG